MGGMSLGILLSVVFVVSNSAFPNIAHLGRIKGGNRDDRELDDADGEIGNDDEYYYRDTKRYPNAHQHRGVAIVRLDAPLFFANCAYFKGIVHEAIKGKFHAYDDPIRFVIFDASGWQDVDLSGIQTLNELYQELVSSGIQLAFANAKFTVRNKLVRSKFVEKLGKRFMCMSIDHAVDSIEKRRRSLMEEVEEGSNPNSHIRTRLLDTSQHNPTNDECNGKDDYGNDRDWSNGKVRQAVENYKCYEETNGFSCTNITIAGSIPSQDHKDNDANESDSSNSVGMGTRLRITKPSNFGISHANYLDPGPGI